MGIGAAKTEGTDAGITRHGAARPGTRLGQRHEGGTLEAHQRMRCRQVECGRQLFVAQRQQHLDETGNAGGCQQMADIGLDTADGAVARLEFAKGARQGTHFDRVADRCTGAMRLDIADLCRCYAGLE